MMTLKEWNKKYEGEYAKQLFGTTKIETLTEVQKKKLQYELELEHHFYKEEHI